MKKLIKSFLLPSVLLALSALGYFLYKDTHKVAPESLYKLQEITKGDIEQSVSANGTLNPVTLVSVGTQVSGIVKNLYVDFNSKVEKGQVLLELDDSLLKAQIAQTQGSVNSAAASVELAKANEARFRTLYAQEYASKQDLDTAVQALKSANAQLQTAQAQLQHDKTNLSYSIIRSPVSGVVVDRQIDVGQTVASSFQTPMLIKIAQDLSKMQIDTTFAEADIGNIKVGQKAKFNVDAYPNRDFEGVVKQIRLNPTNTSNVVAYDVVISVDNADQVLLPGMTAYVSIVFAKHDNVMLVPNAALRYKPKIDTSNDTSSKKGNWNKNKKKPQDSQTDSGFSRGKLYILQDGKPQVRRVKVGITDSKLTEVNSDELKIGDKIIVSDLQADSKDNRASGMHAPRMF